MFPFGRTKTFDGKDYDMIGETPDKNEANGWAEAYRQCGFLVRIEPRVHIGQPIQYEVYAFLGYIPTPGQAKQ